MSDEVQKLKDEISQAAAEEEQLFPPPPPPAEPAPPVFTPQEIDDAFARNEFGDAMLAVKLLRGKYCFDNTAKLPYRFNGIVWELDVNNSYMLEMEKLSPLYYGKLQEAQKTVGELKSTGADKEEIKEAKGLVKAYAGRIKQLDSTTRAKKVFEHASSGDGRIGISGREWNTNPLLLPCTNCVVDLETGKMVPGRHDQYFNKTTGTEYLGMHFEAPLWDDILDKALCRDEELKEYFLHSLGCAVLGWQTKDFFVAYGPQSNNAKSLIYDTLMKVIGAFSLVFPVTLLTEKNQDKDADAPSSQIGSFDGIRFAVSSEANASQRFDFGKVKEFTSGGDKVRIREHYARHFKEFSFAHTPVLHTNRIPTTRGVDKGFYTRMRVLPFFAQFIKPEDGPADPANNIYHRIPRSVLEEQLLREYPGILAMCVRYARKVVLLGDMPPPPTCVTKHTDEYKEDQDLVGAFLRDCCEMSESNEEQMKMIYAAFFCWCVQEKKIHEKKVWAMRTLSDELRVRPGITRRESNKVFYGGIGLTNHWEGEAIMHLAREDKRRKVEKD